jgi:hypothetical protein
VASAVELKGISAIQSIVPAAGIEGVVAQPGAEVPAKLTVEDAHVYSADPAGEVGTLGAVTVIYSLPVAD